jgi:hypothetical protein
MPFVKNFIVKLKIPYTTFCSILVGVNITNVQIILHRMIRVLEIKNLYNRAIGNVGFCSVMLNISYFSGLDSNDETNVRLFQYISCSKRYKQNKFFNHAFQKKKITLKFKLPRSWKKWSIFSRFAYLVWSQYYP